MFSAVHGLEACGFSSGSSLAVFAELLCGGLHLLPVLVGAGLEAYVEAVEALEAGQHVGGDGFVGVADVRFAIGVGDGGGDVERSLQS